MIVRHHRIPVSTTDAVQVLDVGDLVQERVAASGIREGMALVTSLHTTCALTVNENEARLLEDIRTHFLRLMPPDARYLHNDLHLRDCPPDEPENAHAHLIAMMLGNGEQLAVHEGRLVLGRWQSLLLVELDGPRERTLAVQLLGR